MVIGAVGAWRQKTFDERSLQMLQRGESDTLPPSFVFALVEKDGQPAALAALYFHPGASEGKTKYIFELS